ncbi:MAG: MATE family efflux transporter [Clostridia bacterium]|nr:MATE family efflux transporter [Clostridia bacterium]
MARSNMDMTRGPITKNMLTFALPLMASGVLQLLFNAADSAVVGRFTGSEALAAVGSNGPLINLIVTLFMGLSVGTNVLTAQYLGSGKHKDLQETVSTSILSSALFGCILVVLGFILARPMLNLVKSPEDVIDLSELYIRIYFLGMPMLMIYNYGSAILRAIGDTRRPLVFMVISGVMNVVLNLILVIVFHMGVAGVAIATVASETVSAVLVLRCLMLTDDVWRFSLKGARINWAKLGMMTRIGLPAGLQGASFAISNILIQKSINSFGSAAMAGNAAAANIEGFCYVGMDCFSQAAISFTGQNFGAKQYKRIDKVLLNALCLGTAAGIIFGVPAYIFGRPLLSIFSDDPAVIDIGILRMGIICVTQFTSMWMNVPGNVCRAMGKSVFPMVNIITSVCVFRVIWITTVFTIDRSLTILYLSYPISWVIAGIVGLIYYMHVRKKLLAGASAEAAA